MTDVLDTSVQAYRQTDSKILQDQVILALQAIGESCIADVADRIGKDRSIIAPRFYELYNANVIILLKDKRKSAATGKASYFYRLRRPGELIPQTPKPKAKTKVQQAARVMVNHRIDIRRKIESVSVRKQLTLF